MCVTAHFNFANIKIKARGALVSRLSYAGKWPFKLPAASSSVGSYPAFAARYTNGCCRETAQTLQTPLPAHSRPSDNLELPTLWTHNRLSLLAAETLCKPKTDRQIPRTEPRQRAPRNAQTKGHRTQSMLHLRYASHVHEMCMGCDPGFWPTQSAV